MSEATVDLERSIRDVGRELADRLPRPSRRPLDVLDRVVNARVADDAALRAALFRFVDAMPVCRSDEEVVEHLLSYLSALERAPWPLLAARRFGGATLARPLVARTAVASVRHLARRFIVAETPERAVGALRTIWAGDMEVSVDLLGEASVQSAEADVYASRCANALGAIADAARSLGAGANGAEPREPFARVNLSVKVSALTPLLRPQAPEEGVADARDRLRRLLRIARDLRAHLHIDMESLDAREAVRDLIFETLGEEEFIAGPPAGLVLQAYLRDSPDELARVLQFAASCTRTAPLVVRLVKGAYWDHEVTEARQHGWSAPVFESKAATDANYERLTRALLDARPAIGVAIASHNLRSVSHAIAYNRACGRGDRDLEFQVLRGLGDELAVALARGGFRVRTYCPIGDLVAGMAYLVRRLLENTSNESFLRAQARGTSLDELLAAP